MTKRINDKDIIDTIWENYNWGFDRYFFDQEEYFPYGTFERKMDDFTGNSVTLMFDASMLVEPKIELTKSGSILVISNNYMWVYPIQETVYVSGMTYKENNKSCNSFTVTTCHYNSNNNNKRSFKNSEIVLNSKNGEIISSTSGIFGENNHKFEQAVLAFSRMVKTGNRIKNYVSL